MTRHEEFLSLYGPSELARLNAVRGQLLEDPTALDTHGKRHDPAPAGHSEGNDNGKE